MGPDVHPIIFYIHDRKGIAMKYAIVVLIAVFIFSGCVNNRTAVPDVEDIDIQNQENSGAQGEGQMSDTNYITKEKFLEYIATQNVGITLDDLEGIDIDDFIVYSNFTEESVKILYLDKALERYLRDLKYRKLEPYMAIELTSADSTDEEFQKYKEKYFNIIGMAYEHEFVDEYGIDNYRFQIDDKKHTIGLGKTQNLGDCKIDKNNKGFYCVEYIQDQSGLVLSVPIYYSKNAKYFILADMYNEAEYELISIFCEMDD